MKRLGQRLMMMVIFAVVFAAVTAFLEADAATPMYWVRIQFSDSYKNQRGNDYVDVDGLGRAKVTVVQPGENSYNSIYRSTWDHGFEIDFDVNGYVNYSDRMQISNSTGWGQWASYGALQIRYNAFGQLDALNNVIGAVHIEYRDDVGWGGFNSHLLLYAERQNLYGNGSLYELSGSAFSLPGEQDYNQFSIDLDTGRMYRGGMNTQFRVAQLVHPIKAVRIHSGLGEQVSVREIWLGIFRRMESH